MPIGPGYDANQVIEASFNNTSEALNVINLGGNLVPNIYDEIDLTYVPSGNGAGQVQTATYKLASLTVATLTLSYDSGNRLVTVVRT